MTISLAVPDILVARAQSGDLEALEALYRAFETPVYNLALRVLRRPEDAEDVLQETFLEVVRSINQYRGEGHLWGWIRQIAASKALMRIRHDRVRETEELHEESVVGVRAGGGVGGVGPGVGGGRIEGGGGFEGWRERWRAGGWRQEEEGDGREEGAEEMGKTVGVSEPPQARVGARELRFGK